VTRRFVAIFSSFALAIGVVAVLPASPALASPGDAAILDRIEKSDQVIIVTAPDRASTAGTLRTYEKRGDNWQIVQGNTRAQLGYGGLVKADARRQGTGTTPIGTFAITSAFGRAKNPGTTVDYIRVDRNDAWTYNPRVPSTYNIFQSVNKSWKPYGNYVEMLWDYGYQYDYVAVMDFNLPAGPIRTKPNGVRVTNQPGDLRRGGGIFLHVDNGKKTAGCIAIDRSVMKEVMSWLDPTKNPVIVVEPDRAPR
jgi:L,D-peptidoglycan transpeptidase YkuD (ErfK/YbiS/YcfS/YnhG family)